MTTPQPAPQPTGDASFDAYTAALESGDAPLLGHLVLYSIYDGEVTRADLEGWFGELGLDPELIPPPVRQVDAYERVTGRDGVKVTYPREDPSATGPAYKRKVGRKAASASSTVTLMLRPVRRDGGQIVRHIVREVRDPLNTKLEYETRIGAATFHRNHDKGATEGAGTLQVEPNNAAISALPEAEQETVRAMLEEIETTYTYRCTYLTGDKLRAVVRRYIESLSAIRVRPSGGVYFVHRQHAATLAALRELASRFQAGSHLARIPLPDQDEMREMIISAFTTKAKEDLTKLSRDIAEAQSEGRHADAQKLHARFTELQDTTTAHAELLSNSLDDTKTALDLVKLQLGSLLATATASDDDNGDEE